MTEAIPRFVVGVVGPASTGSRAVLVDAIEAAGAAAEPCTEANALSKALGVDALVFDVGETIGSLGALALTLASDPRTALLPRIVIVRANATAEAIAPLSPAVIVPVDETGTARESAIRAAIGVVLEQVGARNRREQRARAEIVERQAVEDNLAALQGDSVTLAHDARVLFGVILGFAANLRDGFSGAVTEGQRTQLVNIVEAANDAANLLERYVAAVRKIVGESATEIAPPSLMTRRPARRHVDFAEVVRSTVALFDGLAREKRISLVALADRAVYAWCDAMQLKQALVNLLANALKFTPTGGQVEVACRMGAPASTRGGATSRRDAEIVVADTGPGIPSQDQDKVFERGARLERDRALPGTGIGLAVVRDIIELHGGFVRIEEAPGGGASFLLAFPADLRGRASDHPASPPRRASSLIPAIRVLPPSASGSEGSK